MKLTQALRHLIEQNGLRVDAWFEKELTEMEEKDERDSESANRGIVNTSQPATDGSVTPVSSGDSISEGKPGQVDANGNATDQVGDSSRRAD